MRDTAIAHDGSRTERQWAMLFVLDHLRFPLWGENATMGSFPERRRSC
jgi:hypothetical protein